MTRLHSRWVAVRTWLVHVLTNVFGRWRWEAPGWLQRLGTLGGRAWRFLAANPVRAMLLTLAALAVGGGYIWYLTRPKPHYVAYAITEPGLTEYNDRGISSVKPMRIVFSESAAPLTRVNAEVTAGIGLSPSLPGSWFWTNDKELRFTPRDDWPVDGAFTVRMAAKGLLASQVRLEDYTFKFRSQPFVAKITESQFYQDPRDPNLKKLVATVSFSHPVDPQSFESHVALAVARDAAYLGLAPDSRNFRVAYDKFKLAAYVHSARAGDAP